MPGNQISSPSIEQEQGNTIYFFEEFSTLLEILAIYPGNLIIAGDFNFQVNVPSNPQAHRLLNELEAHGLSQLTQLPTPKAGHILDLVISCSDAKLVSDISIIDPGLSDHAAVLFTLSIPKPPHLTRTISFRKLKAINKAKFIKDLSLYRRS